MESPRLDQWLWAVRLFKTRSMATAACRRGRVRVNGIAVKASTQVKVGDRIEAFIARQRVVVVSALIEKRVGATVAATCFVDHSPPAPTAKRQPPMPRRAPGMGRPTKRERRALDRVTRPDSDD